MSELKWTGERLVTLVHDGSTIEHLHRYSIAMALVKDKIVLDIASGEGYGTHLLSKNAKTIYGVDIDKEAIIHSKTKYNKENLFYLLGQADKIPLETSCIDVVVSFETIEHLENHEGMFLELKRVLKPNGILMISSPERGIWPDNHYHVKELSNNEFKALLSKHFKHISFYYQKIIMGSLIVPQDSLSVPFSFHEGNFDTLSAKNHLQNPVFNLCIASDAEIKEIGNSFFDGELILKKQIAAPYQNSRIWKAMQFLKKTIKKN